MKKVPFLILCWLAGTLPGTLLAQAVGSEPHRPQVHFTPRAHWMNDPNGMLYYQGTYHLFFQYYPDGTTWGPMHWGHATSPDMVRWQEQPIALFPDSLGYIFSGSAVVDVKNTSGFGQPGQTPLVAIFTHHNPVLEKAKRNDVEYQSLAYSLDAGKTWTKYPGNPVLPNPGIRDFRDPKVRWYEPQQKWIMTLATQDRITFYSSPNLKDWTRESEFGRDVGAHGGVWECPDLFPLRHQGKDVWVLLVSINPGGPNQGSATQYFLGDFDGKDFKAYTKDIQWMDYGPDNYAGVTFANTGDRTLLMGWMSNWQYAEKVPTHPWRSAMTIPRELGLQEVNKTLYLTSQPAQELKVLEGESTLLKKIKVPGTYNLTEKIKNPTGVFRLELTTPSTGDFAVVLANEQGEEVEIGYDRTAHAYYIDRSKAGKVDFEKGFGKRSTAPRLAQSTQVSLTLVVDASSVELFADNGLTVMTSLFFPNKDLTKVLLKAAPGTSVPQLRYTALKPATK
ncbi:glycoside hydrolase family 32 protein [Rhabdobacter roseus]|uniref:Fructan beta-fructosidase n=1 Tax=Rhabdobacter roseus TaxID=1655419 RepID=A0A840TR12_9BACT|nr:glycoside hydrolase family 32 protein [Rhabdobacter roseus]MBB5282480.1 fructan beta-fructosidase [Rhabdobacter roseus]